MKNIVSLSLLLAALAVVVYFSPEPLYVRTVSAEDGEGAAAALLKNVQERTKDAYLSAAEYAERTGDGIRQTGADLVDRVSSLVGGKPKPEDLGTKEKSLLDRAADAVNWRSKQDEEGFLRRAAEAVNSRSKQEDQEAVSNWQRAKEKLNKASHAASEAASHIKDTLFHKATEGTRKAQEVAGSYAGQSTDETKQKVQEGAQSAYSTLQDTAASSKDTIGSTFERVLETLTSAKDTAGERLQEGAQNTYATYSRSASSAYKAAGEYGKAATDYGNSAYTTAGEYGTAAYNTAGEYGTSAYNSARDRAAEAFDLASEKAGSAYETMSIAVQMLTDTVRAIPSRTAEYAGSASDRLGSATQSAIEAGSAAVTGSAVYDTVRRAPESAQEAMEYVKNVFPDISAESWKQRAKEAGEYLPNVGEGLSYGTNTFEDILENLRKRLSFGRTDEERKGIMDRFKNTLPAYSQEDRASMLDILRAKLGYAPTEESKAQQSKGLDDEDVNTTIQKLAEKLVGAPTREERRSILEEAKGMLAGYSKEERKGIIDGLKGKLASYIPSSEVSEEWEGRVSTYFRGQRKTGPSLDELAKDLAEAGPEERANILEGLKSTLRGYSKEERRGPLHFLKQKLATHSPEDEGKRILDELKRELAEVTGVQGKGTETAKGKLTEVQEKAAQTAGVAIDENAEESVTENIRDKLVESTQSGQGVHGGYGSGEEYLRQIVGEPKDHNEETVVEETLALPAKSEHEQFHEEEGFFEYLKQKLRLGGNKPDHDSDKHTTEQAQEDVGKAAASASEKLEICRQNYAPEDDGEVDIAKEKAQFEQQRESAATKGTERGPCGMNYLDSVGPAVAVASTIEKISKPENQPEEEKEVEEKDEEVAEKYVDVTPAPTGGFFTSLARLLHLAGFALSYGTSIWMTVFSGQILSKAVTRQQFGRVQSLLFPAYLKVAASGLAVVFLMHWFQHPWSGSYFSEKLQFLSLFITLLANIANIYYLEPQVSWVMFERLKLEKEEASADDSAAASATTRKSDAADMAKQFNILHGYSSLVNFISLVGQTWHLWYLSRRLVI